jgi:penicillin amidase
MRIVPILLSCVCLLATGAAAGPVHGPKEAYGKVELVRDTWGVPHVFSDTDAGAMYGLGHAAAEERAFQMHYNLRIIQGRLAEVVGERRSVRRPKETAVDNDRKMRTFGFYRAAKDVAKNLDADTVALLEAYCEGVNGYAGANRGKLHPLFAKLGLEPEPWTPADCVASWWHLGQFFAGDGTRELLHWRNLKQAPAGGRPGPAPSLLWYDDDAAVVARADVTDEWLGRVQAFARQNGIPVKAPPATGPAGPKFSHAWVVGGKKTTTGSAVLVSDPQTPVRNPSLWHEFHVRGKTFNVRGIGVPGSPGILVGWNEHVAWGATALGADQADLFRLKTDAEHPDAYFFDGAWRKMAVVRETVPVKDGQPVELVVRLTHLGPVVTPFAFAAPGDPEVALKRVPVCQTDRETVQALFGMMRAMDVKTFRTALSGWQFPSAHLVFGDRAGAIGYQLAAAVPVRSPQDEHQGAAALDGTRADSDWKGYVPHDLLPHVINPARGWIASANHRAVGSFYPLPLGLSTGSQGHTLRSWRLYERLSSREKFTASDVLDVHFDTVNPARRDIVRAALHLRDRLKQELSLDAASALEHLGPWHGRGAKSDVTEPAAALAAELNTFFRFVHTPLVAKYGGGETGLSRFLRDLNERLASDPNAPLTRDEQNYVDRALASAWKSAADKYGDDPKRWNDSARQAVQMLHLGYFDTLDGFGSLHPWWDLESPDLTCVDGGTIQSQAGQSYTQYVPLHDVDAAMSVLPPGHSEHEGDPARTSTMQLWANAQLHPAPLSRAAVERIATNRKVLSK